MERWGDCQVGLWWSDASSSSLPACSAMGALTAYHSLLRMQTDKMRQVSMPEEKENSRGVLIGKIYLTTGDRKCKPTMFGRQRARKTGEWH